MVLVHTIFYSLHKQTGYNDEEDDEQTDNIKKAKVKCSKCYSKTFFFIQNCTLLKFHVL